VFGLLSVSERQSKPLLEEDRIILVKAVAEKRHCLLALSLLKCVNPATSLIAQLGDERYKVRSEAYRRLLAMGRPIRELLLRHRDHKDLETRSRVLALVKELETRDKDYYWNRLLLTWLTDFWML